jgi:anti-anti-sigma regulatory factor
MPARAQPVAASAASEARLLGETTAVVSAGPWFSAVTSATFADLAAEIRDGGAQAMVLDLSAVRAIDAAGTATLGALAEQLDVVGCELAVAATHPGLVEWLITAPLDIDLPVHSTVDEALADLLRRPV